MNVDDCDAAATEITGIPLVRPWQVVPSDGSLVASGDEWGDETTWSVLGRALQVERVKRGSRMVIVSRSPHHKEIPTVTTNKRPSAEQTEAEYEGLAPEPDLADDEGNVNLAERNAVQAEMGTKASIVVRLPGGETCDALTEVEAAFEGPVSTIPADMPTNQQVFLRQMLAALVMDGTRNAKGFWEPANVLVIGRFNKSATQYRTAEGWMDTSVQDVPHLVWVLVPKGHRLEDTGVRGICIRFLPDSGDPAYSRDGLKQYPRLDATTIVGYTKFYSGADAEAHQTKVVRSLQAIHQATTAADRVEREPDADGGEGRTADEALNAF